MEYAIVVGDGHHNTLGLVRSLGEKGVKVILFVSRGTRAPVCRSRYIDKIYYFGDVNDCVSGMSRLCGLSSSPVAVLCGSDVLMRMLDARYDELKGKFILFNVGSKAGCLSFYQNKINTFALAEECGFKKIPTWEVCGGDSVPNDIVYPCLVKGANSTINTKADMRICRTSTELKEFLVRGTSYLIQEYIEKDVEIDAVGIAWNGGLDMYMPAVVRKIRDSLIRQSGYICLEDVQKFEGLNASMFSKFVRGMGYEGIFSIELIKRGNDYYFLEANLRNDGVGYLYTAAGVNYPYMWYLYGRRGLNAEVVRRISPRLPYYLMDLKDFRNMIEGQVGLFRWLWQGLSANAHFVMNIKDPKPFFCSLWLRILECFR